MADFNELDAGSSACGCEGISPETPVRVYNRSGLDRIGYRMGTQARFFESMLARLSEKNFPMLRQLNTRATDDLTIALLDSCAVGDDGLSFYLERFANEWYVRTAIERVSLVQLARLIGYEPRPGLAASVQLAFTIEDTPGTPEKTLIDAGTRVMSIPGKDELPQTYETSAPIEARSIWNAMRARTQEPQTISKEMKAVVVKGIETAMKVGDRLLIIEEGGTKAVKVVRRIVQDAAASVTRIEIADPSPPTSNFLMGMILLEVQLFSYGASTQPPLGNNVFGSVFTASAYSTSDVSAISSINQWSETKLSIAINTPPPPPVVESFENGIFALRQRASIFGHNAPRWASLPQIVQGQNVQITGRVLESNGSPQSDKTKWQYPTNWDNLDLSDTAPADKTIDMDNVYPAMTEKGWLVMESPFVSAKVYSIVKNQETTRSDYTLSVKVTRLELDSKEGFESLGMRDTTVYGQSEKLNLADLPIPDDVSGNTLMLDKYYPGLVAGQTVIVSGTRTDLRGVIDHEARILSEVTLVGDLAKGRGYTLLKFSIPLDYTFERATVTVNANVALATHGETKYEAMGGGDGAKRYQEFTLKASPLTYVSASTPTGTQSTLEVRVNDVLWHETNSLYGKKPDERVYIVRHEDDGRTRVQFNAPIPSGQENVQAKYRAGIGLAGRVKAGQLTLLTVKPLGVKNVNNPLPAGNAEDRETIEALRDNSPLTVLTLDRLVSLKDYEDFGRAFAGFSKALAVPTADGAARGVFLTVAGSSGEVDESSKEFLDLKSALKANGDPLVSVMVKPYRPAFFQIEGVIGVDPNYLPEKVEEAAHAMLRERFGFGARKFGQAVTAVEVIAALQNVPGVVFVDLNYLFRTDALTSNAAKTLETSLAVHTPSSGTSQLSASPAELLTLDPRPIAVTAILAKGTSTP